MQSEVSTVGGGRTVAELEQELAQGRRREEATAEILRIISMSPANPQPVFDAIVASAIRLLGGYTGSLSLVAGDQIVSATGDAVVRAAFPQSLRSERGVAQVIRARVPLNIADAYIDPRMSEGGRAAALTRGFRSVIAVPLLRHGEALGAIVVSRHEPGGFSNDEIALVETFASQAVIAIENTRLFEAEQARTRDLTEALEYQNATTEVLGVISRSPTELQSVFDEIAAKALELCGALTGAVLTFDGQLIHVAAVRSFSAELASMRANFPMAPSRGGATARAILSNAPAYVSDVLDDPEYQLVKIAADIGFRSILSVPMLREGKPIGAITITAAAPRAFNPKVIELLQTFANQAVIAIENARLFEEVQARTGEVTEALEYQTAISNVLGAISRSKFHLQPVLDTLVQSATRLCEADMGFIVQQQDGIYQSLASFGAPPEFDDYLAHHPIEPGRGSMAGRVALAGATVQIEDVFSDPEYTRAEATQRGSYSALLGTPLIREGKQIGVIVIASRAARRFSDKQVRLIETFADQAVIAIENTRLFEEVQARTHELQESLEYQTATTEVLDVISRSPTNSQPVLDAIAVSVRRLASSAHGSVFLFDGEQIHLAAHAGIDDPVAVRALKQSFPQVPDRGSATARALLSREVAYIPDVLADVEYRVGDVAKAAGYRSIVSVPMLRDGHPVGAITASAAKSGAFSQRQITLLQTFGNQAVIAINNAGLFEQLQARTRELTESLEYQTATSDVLSVISRSPTDVQPVFDSIAAKAARLCGGVFSNIQVYDGEFLHMVGTYKIAETLDRFPGMYPRRPDRAQLSGRAVMACEPVHVHDVLEDPEYPRDVALAGGWRAMLAVPMLRDGNPVGTITVSKSEPIPFSSRQIELLKTFADQAVIAIENTRLFEEVQAITHDLQESLDYQTATNEVLKALSRSTFDLEPILKSVVQTAARLCDADMASIFQSDDGVYRWRVGYSLNPAYEAIERESFIRPDRSTLVGRVALNGQALHVEDAWTDPEYAQRSEAQIGNVRTMLGVPLLREGQPIGVIALARARVEQFTQKQIALVATFADQSVIAIENVRLFSEIVQKSRELEIASQHKSQFVANMSHELRTPLAAILGYAELMQEGFYGTLSEKSTDALTRIRSNGKHLLGLINTVLDIAKIESGQFSLNIAEYAIESVVETVRAATESLAQYKKLALTTDFAKRLPIGLGDEQRLTQVLLNLVGNAIKFTDTGEVRITATAMNGQFTVAVTDTGPGIPPEELKRVFEQFHQIDNSNTKAKGGTGLGLAIAKQIVEMHGGRIWVESTVGKGATFQMELPIRAEFRKAAE